MTDDPLRSAWRAARARHSLSRLYREADDQPATSTPVEALHPGAQPAGDTAAPADPIREALARLRG